MNPNDYARYLGANPEFTRAAGAYGVNGRVLDFLDATSVANYSLASKLTHHAVLDAPVSVLRRRVLEILGAEDAVFAFERFKVRFIGGGVQTPVLQMFWNAKGAGRDAHADVRRLQESVGRAGGIAYRSTANPRLPPEVSNYTHHVYYVPGAQAVPGVTYFVDMANPHEGAFPLRVAVSGEKYAGADGNRLNGLIRPLDTATLYEARGPTVPEDVRAKLVGVAYDRTMGGLAEKLTSLAFPAAVWTRDRTVLVKRDGESIAERMKNWEASQLQNAVRRMDMDMDLVDDLMDVIGSVFDAARAESEDDFDSIVATCVGASNAARILANAVLAQQGRPPLPAPVAEGVWFRSLKDACPFLDAARTSCRLDIVVPTDGTPERTPVDLDSLLRPAHNS